MQTGVVLTQSKLSQTCECECISKEDKRHSLVEQLDEGGDQRPVSGKELTHVSIRLRVLEKCSRIDRRNSLAS